MNGVNIGSFDLNVPADTESLGLTDDRIRSVKSTFQQVFDDEHTFASSGGAGTGYHRYGSARPYVGTQSRVSSAGTDGRLMYASDTSRLFGVGSEGTVFIGGQTVVSLGTIPGSLPQRHIWVEEVGAGMTNASGNLIVAFPNSGFSGLPYVFPSLVTTNATSGGAYGVSVFALSASACSIQVWQTDTLASIQSAHVMWRSLGSRVL
jgi:hypothetical protein